MSSSAAFGPVSRGSRASRRRRAGCRSAPRGVPLSRSAPRPGNGRRARSRDRRPAHSRESPRRSAWGSGRDVIVTARWRRRRRPPAELADVGPGDKAAPGADQHHRLDRGIGVSLVDRRRDALRHPRRQRVHRRVVDRDDPDITVLLEPTNSRSPSAISFSRRDFTSEAVRQ